jgi:hypothetical protein
MMFLEARATAASYCRMLWENKDPRAERDKRILEEQFAQGMARTVRQVIEEFDNAILTDLARNTQIHARRALRIVNQTIGDMPIAMVTKQIVVDLLNGHLEQ